MFCIKITSLVSKDLRQKVLEACLEGKESFRKIAERVKTSRSFIASLWKRYKETEKLEHVHPRGSRFKINHKKLAVLYEQETGVRITESTSGKVEKRFISKRIKI